MRHVRSGLALAAILVGTGLAGCEYTTQTRYHGYVISDAMLQQVPVGASKAQVELALGSPSTTSTVPESGDVYYYISQRTEAAVAFMSPRIVDQRVVAVYFDGGERVSRLANYGMQDGKVFDFVTRTTPSGGSEVSFLSQIMAGGARPSFGN